MGTRTDEQLMARFSKGDQTAFTQLYQRHKGALYRYFVRQLNGVSEERAEELYQDVWYRVIDKRETYSPSAKFTTWLYRIAHNLLVDEYRKSLSELAFRAQLDAEPEVELGESEYRKTAAIKHCITQLAPLQREAFLLRYDSAFEPSQICTIVDAKPETVKTRLRYGLKQLRQCLTRKLGERL